MTKILKELFIDDNTLNRCKNEIAIKIIKDKCNKINEEFRNLCIYIQQQIDNDKWIYIFKQNVYYIPSIASLIHNFNNPDVNTSFHIANYKNSLPNENTNMSICKGMNGSIPTIQEVKEIFNDEVSYFREGKRICINGCCREGCYAKLDDIYYQGNPYTERYCQYNVFKDYTVQKIGGGIASHSIWKIPVFRLNGVNSNKTNAVQSLILLLGIEFSIDSTFWNNEQELEQVYRNLKNWYKNYRNYIKFNIDRNWIYIDEKAIIHEILELGNTINLIDLNFNSILQSNDIYQKEIDRKLLTCDNERAGIDIYDENLLKDPNRGHWDLWDWNNDKEGKSSIPLKHGITARNPEEDINPGIVAIDFGTKSTVVVYENEHLQALPLQVGCGNYRHGVQSKNYENPTIVQFIDLKSFIDSYNARVGRPYTKWEEITVSHTAFENLSMSNSERYCSFFDELKQWCGSNTQGVKIKDAQGYICDLPTFVEIQDGDINPVEIYAYYLGLYINNMLQEKHIFLRYILSFPVTYDSNIREKMRSSFENGLRKSLPTALLCNEKAMEKFKVLEGTSEPAAYAVTALREYGFEPIDDEENYYAVFDFGGGTTDFDFGLLKEADQNRYDYELIHFGSNGDKTLGGENLLKLLAFEVFKNNKEKLLHPDGNNDKEKIPFSWAAEKIDFVGSEGLINNSQEAHLNMHNVMEALRPIWESQDPLSELESGMEENVLTSIRVNLYTDAGKQRANFELSLEGLNLKKILVERISQGVENFFIALGDAFRKCSGKNNGIKRLGDIEEINIFLAGNSSKSILLKEIWNEYTNSDSKVKDLLKTSKEQDIPRFNLYPALGTDEAYEIMKEKGMVVDNILERPSGKTGVAYGLLGCRSGGGYKVTDITPDDTKIQFQYYIGRSKKRKFFTIINRDTRMYEWYPFIDAGGDFDVLYTDKSIVTTNEAPVTIAKCVHVTIENPDEESMVYIRPVSSHTIEYAIGKSKKELGKMLEGDGFKVIDLE